MTLLLIVMFLVAIAVACFCGVHFQARYRGIDGALRVRTPIWFVAILCIYPIVHGSGYAWELVFLMLLFATHVGHLTAVVRLGGRPNWRVPDPMSLVCPNCFRRDKDEQFCPLPGCGTKLVPIRNEFAIENFFIGIFFVFIGGPFVSIPNAKAQSVT